MDIFGIHFSKREEKKQVLVEIISSLDMKPEEKDLYIFSMDILDDKDFEDFFGKMTEMFKKTQVASKSFNFFS